MLLGLASPSALTVGKADLAEIRAEVALLVDSTYLRLAPVLADAEEAAGVLTLPSPRVTAVEVDRRVDLTLVVAFEDPEDFFEIPDFLSDTIYLL
jgi:hypothetical protein